MAVAEPAVEHRQMQGLTEDQIDEIADRAAKKALDMVYQEVGKAALAKLAWFVGIAVMAMLMWMGKNGIDLK